MKNRIFMVGMGIALSLSSLQAFAECENPQFKACLERLGRHAEKAKLSPSQATSKDFITTDRVFDFAPMSEDIGPERIGPTTFERVYGDFLADVERKGQFLSDEAVRQHTRTINMLCERTQTNPDVIEVLTAYEAQESGKPGQNVGLMVGAFAFAVLAAAAFVFFSRKKDGTPSVEPAASDVIPLRPKTQDSGKSGNQNAA